MYEHYEQPERIFVDREEYLEWMDGALEKCSQETVVLNLCGIGGIGKSSLLDYWTRNLESTIKLDCNQHTEFYKRLNVLAKGARLQGVKLSRFDILWNIRQRFVEGVEPVKDKDRAAAREVLALIPFVGTIANIGSALSAVGSKVTPKFRTKFGEVGSWLESRLGKNYVERLLEILWKEPKHAEFLYLDALLEDVNNRKATDSPLVFLFDQSETIDSDRALWRYGGRDLTEVELWHVFLSSLKNCVGVFATRQSAPEFSIGELKVEEKELTELDKESCNELLQERKITGAEFQEKIVSISGGNPFVINTICDLINSKNQLVTDIEDLRSDSLQGVRLKVWRRLFSQTKGLQELLDRAALVPYFNREIMNIIAPSMNVDQWDRLLHLSFVKGRDDGTFVLHDLAKELTISELGERTKALAEEVYALLEKASAEQSNSSFLGLAVSVKAHFSEMEAITLVKTIPFNLVLEGRASEGWTFLEALDIDTQLGRIIVTNMKGWFLTNMMGRIADGEHLLFDALGNARILAEDDALHYNGLVAEILLALGYFYGITTHRLIDAENSYQEAIDILLKKYDDNEKENLNELISALGEFSVVLGERQKFQESEKMSRLGLKLAEDEHFSREGRGLFAIAICHIALALAQYRQGRIHEALEMTSLYTDEAWAFSRMVIHLKADIIRYLDRGAEAEEMLTKTEEKQAEYAKSGALLEIAWHVKLRNSLVQVLMLNGKYEKAEELSRDVLNDAREMVKVAPGYWNILLTWAIHNQARLSKRSGNLIDTEEAYREILEVYRDHEKLTPNFGSPLVAQTLINLGVLLNQTDRVNEAEKAYRESLEILTERVSAHPEAIILDDCKAMALNNLGILLHSTDRTSEAEKAFLESIEIRKKRMKDSPELIKP
ncbi:MAG: tetratricopeptide repeat protein, partial [Candidatus Thorarchaeota archaeon]